MQNARCILSISEPYSDEQVIERSEQIVKFCDDRKIFIDFLRNKVSSRIDVNITVNGFTTAYCRGCITEIKQLLKNNFLCKITTELLTY